MNPVIEKLKEQPIPEADNIHGFKFLVGGLIGKILKSGELTPQEVFDHSGPIREAETIEQLTELIWGDDRGTV